MLNFISVRLMPYLNDAEDLNPKAEKWLSFSIEYPGVIKNVKIKERIISKKQKRSEIFVDLSDIFEMVRLSEFKSTSRYSVTYKLPSDMQPDNDVSELEIQEEGDKIYNVIEMMPRYPGCENISNDVKVKEECAKEKMLDFVYKNLVYPEDAKSNKIEGNTVLQFVVEPDGWLSNIKAVRDSGHGFGDAGIDVIESMNFLEEKWTPGEVRGKVVRALYTLPITFSLKEESTRKKI
ncbi:MAG: energy transducer TonB [Saprospiraceae bacterium]|nr:energy transducer TonB [Saprospiraceae bacterium]